MKGLAWIVVVLLFGCGTNYSVYDRTGLAATIEQRLTTGTLDRWYPAAFDTVHGGFLTAFTYDFKPTDDQRKMIVTQARHTWTNSKAAIRFHLPVNERGAAHGFRFLRDVMWDEEQGGFFQMMTRTGDPIDLDRGKTAYGNSFAIYALAAYYEQSRDDEALELVKQAFAWLDAHSHDAHLRGYFQHLARDGTPIRRKPETPSTSDLGYKDQNSSIHLLEAFTELYQVWPDSVVRRRLEEMLFLIRDTIVTPEGYLTLFLTPAFVPVSFRDSSEAVIKKHHHIDHVSFGHDVETAYLLMEASHVLGTENDTITARVAKKMVDHALANGWDDQKGGFYDEGYYFRDKEVITITADTKNWWAQAEGLNTLLMMADLYPDDPNEYYAKFLLLWEYIDANLIDHENGDWFAGGIDRQPELKTALKGQIWKANYHQYRAMTGVIDRLREGAD